MKLFSVAAAMVLGVATCNPLLAQGVIQNQLDQIYRQNSQSRYSAQQFQRNIVNSALPRYGAFIGNPNRGAIGNVFSSRPQPPRQKPFSGLQQAASNVTPYIGLLSENPFNSSVTNYYSLVRPQLEQQRVNEKIQQQNYMIQRQLNDIAAQAPYDPTGSEQMAPTGHVAVYQNFGGYYPQPAPSASQRRR